MSKASKTWKITKSYHSAKSVVITIGRTYIAASGNARAAAQPLQKIKPDYMEIHIYSHTLEEGSHVAQYLETDG